MLVFVVIYLGVGKGREKEEEKILPMSTYFQQVCFRKSYFNHLMVAPLTNRYIHILCIACKCFEFKVISSLVCVNNAYTLSKF